jgi:hypothetical protein
MNAYSDEKIAMYLKSLREKSLEELLIAHTTMAAPRASDGDAASAGGGAEAPRLEEAAGFGCVPLAGGDGGTSILSTLGRAAGGNALLALLDTRDATAQRGV